MKVKLTTSSYVTSVKSVFETIYNDLNTPKLVIILPDGSDVGDAAATFATAGITNVDVMDDSGTIVGTYESYKYTSARRQYNADGDNGLMETVSVVMYPDNGSGE